MSNVLKSVASSFLKNFKTILQALIFSIIIWLFISIQIFPDITLHISDINVECETTEYMDEENLHITYIEVPTVTVKVQGKRYSISDLTSENFIARCDLSGVRESGEQLVPIAVEVVDSNADCTVVSETAETKINVEKIISREFTVSPNTDDIEIADEMRIEGEVTVEPSTITLSGEEKLINSITGVTASAHYDEKLDHSDFLEATLSYATASGKSVNAAEISADNNDFVVYVPVYKVRTLPVRVQFTGSPVSYSGFNASDLEYTMSIDEITIASPDSSIDNLDAIDIGEISLGTLTLKDLQGGVILPIELPEGYKNISGNRNVTVTFPDAEEFGQLGFTVPSENITVINLPSSYNVKVLTNELMVNVVGYSNYIQGITSSNIFVTVNLFGVELSEGVKSLTPVFRLAGGNVKAWVTGEEYKVDLLITENETTAPTVSTDSAD